MVANLPGRSTVPRSGGTGAFLAITFVWAWAFWGYWVVAMPPGGLRISAPFVLTAIIGGLAPSLAALLVVWWAGGVPALRAFMRQLPVWPDDRPAVAVAVFLVPAMTAISVAVQSLAIGPLVWPDPVVLGVALIWPLFAALGEEFGWRGVLLPRLANRLGLMPAAVIVGLIWGLWHLPADYVALKGYGGWFWLAFLLNGPVVLTGHSLIMAWIWQRTGRRLTAPLLYHMTITASAMVAPTSGSDGAPGIMAAAIGAGSIWAAALLLLMFRRHDLSPLPAAPVPSPHAQR